MNLYNATRIYVASSTRHACLWLEARKRGFNIVSTWIDEAGEGESDCYSSLAVRCLEEVSQSDALILYADSCEDMPHGAYLEAGSALTLSIPVYFVGSGCNMSRVFKSHPLLLEMNDIESALIAATSQAVSPRASHSFEEVEGGGEVYDAGHRIHGTGNSVIMSR